MTRRLAVFAAMLAVSAGVSCLPPEAEPRAERSAPLVGRLQLNDRVLDLDVGAFVGPNAVPTSSYARIMANIDMDTRTSAERAGAESEVRAGARPR